MSNPNDPNDPRKDADEPMEDLEFGEILDDDESADEAPLAQSMEGVSFDSLPDFSIDEDDEPAPGVPGLESTDDAGIPIDNVGDQSDPAELSGTLGYSAVEDGESVHSFDELDILKDEEDEQDEGAEPTDPRETKAYTPMPADPDINATAIADAALLGDDDEDEDDAKAPHGLTETSNVDLGGELAEAGSSSSVEYGETNKGASDSEVDFESPEMDRGSAEVQLSSDFDRDYDSSAEYPKVSGSTSDQDILATVGVDGSDGAITADDLGGRGSSSRRSGKKGGVGLAVACGIAGLLVGGGGVAGAWYGGLLPGDSDRKVAGSGGTGTPTTAPPVGVGDADKIAQLTQMRDALEADKERAEAQLTGVTDVLAKAGYEDADPAAAAAGLVRAKEGADAALKTAMAQSPDPAKLAAAEKELADARDMVRTLTEDMKLVQATADKKLQDQQDQFDKMMADATKQLTTANVEVARLSKDLKAAEVATEEKLKDQEAEFEKMMADPAKPLADARAEVARLGKALEAAEAAAAEKLKEQQTEYEQMMADSSESLTDAKAEARRLTEELQTAKADAEKELTAQEERYRKMLADARKPEAEKPDALREYAIGRRNAGELPPEDAVTLKGILDRHPEREAGDVEVFRPNPRLAARLYSSGVGAFFAGEYEKAESSLIEAVRNDDQDARYLYFLGLTRWAQGNSAAAEEDFRTAAALERRGRPTYAVVSDALERIQGEQRRVLNRYRP